MNVPISPQQLPSGFCPTGYQEMWVGFAAAGFVNIPDSAAPIIRQSSKPTDPTVNWLQLDSLGRPVRLYEFAQGAWLSIHPIVPGLTMWWFNILPDFTTFDGGDANPLSDISGPMWQQAKDNNGNLIAAKFLLTPGTLPSGTVVALGDTGGQETITLAATNLPTHNHQLWVGASDGTVPGIKEALQTVDNPHAGTPAAYQLSDGVTDHNNYVKNAAQGDVNGNPVAINTMPLYLVGYLLQRSDRIFYAVN